MDGGISTGNGEKSLKAQKEPRVPFVCVDVMGHIISKEGVADLARFATFGKTRVVFTSRRINRSLIFGSATHRNAWEVG